MMDKCLPALIASALFFALIVWDIISREYYRMPGHFLFGLFIILTFLALCSKGFEYVAWIIVLIPVVLIAAGYISQVVALPAASTGYNNLDYIQALSSQCLPPVQTGCPPPMETGCPPPVETGCPAPVKTGC